MLGRPSLELGGLIVGKLTVIKKTNARDKGHVLWKCKCSCGNYVTVRAGHLKEGLKKSCGCIREQHRRSDASEYKVWAGMKTRCYNVKNKRYTRYGGRGIRVCESWKNSFSQFIKDMGPRPSLKHSIDSIDNDGNYEPDNCRWATEAEQGNNTSRVRRITYEGETLTTREWSRKLDISYKVLNDRFKRGWSVDRAFNQKVRKSPNNRKKSKDSLD